MQLCDRDLGSLIVISLRVVLRSRSLSRSNGYDSPISARPLLIYTSFSVSLLRDTGNVAKTQKSFAKKSKRFCLLYANLVTYLINSMQDRYSFLPSSAHCVADLLHGCDNLKRAKIFRPQTRSEPRILYKRVLHTVRRR